jgi:glycerate 2-kinase
MNFENERGLLQNASSEKFRVLRRDALDILTDAVEAVDPYAAIKNSLEVIDGRLLFRGGELDLGQFERIFVVGGGKASGLMAKAVEELLGDLIVEGHVNVLRGTEGRFDLKKIKLHGASHPVPDEGGMKGVDRMLSLMSGAREDDLFIFLVSGGGSALLTKPADGVKLEDLRTLTDSLLKKGATINELNSVRKHISAIKGGLVVRKAQPAKILSLILSDVVGDHLDTIASGLTAPDTTTFSDAINTLKRYDLWEESSNSIRVRLEKGFSGDTEETPKPGDKIFKRVMNVLIGNNLMAALAAVEKASSIGYNSMLLSTRIEGEARHTGKVLAGIAQEVLASGRPTSPPAALIAGGETTVTVTGSGSGGRNQELALGAALKIEGLSVVLAAMATDGIDGPTEAAGAISDGSTLARAQVKGLDAMDRLQENDSYTFFNTLGDVLITGPTGTNVNDITVILVSE